MAIAAQAAKTSPAILPFRIVAEYKRMVIFRLGRIKGVRGPGVVWVLPFFDRVLSVDLRESFLEIPHQTLQTQTLVPA